MARAMWKGVLRMGRTEIAFKLYAGVRREGVHFRLLHRKDLRPVAQRMVDASGEVVDSEAVQKAAQVETGEFVVLSDEELASLEPEPSREVEVSAFVPLSAIPHGYFERPYYLAPDGQGQAYAALAQAMARDQVAGIGHWVMRKRRYLGALTSDGKVLALTTLRPAEEVLELPNVAPAAPVSNKKELAMAKQLVEALADHFDPDAYHDRYSEEVRTLAEKKARGESIRFPRAPARKKTQNLARSLEASLKAVRRTG